MASNLYKKYESSASTCTTEGSSASSSPPSPVNPHHGQQQPTNNAPKYGTLVPNRVFVGGISGNTTESELAELFSTYGNVKATKVISDRAGVSKGYGFVTFETEEEANRLMREESIILKERKLNIAPAIKKQPFSRSYEVASPPAVAGNTIFYQNGMPYTFHNGVAYFTSTAPPHAAAASPLATGADPNTVYQTAYVSPTATAHSPAASYPVIYPCTAQPVFMSQQFQYQPVPPPTQNSQYVYTAASSPSSSASGGGAPPPGTPLPTLPPQHYYSPSPMTSGELYYNMTPVAAGQAYGPLMAADGILYETPPGTESSNNPSAEDSSSNSSRSDLPRSGGNFKAVQDSKTNGIPRRDKVNPPPPTRRQNATPPVVSLLKLQQAGSGEEAEGVHLLPRSVSASYLSTPPPAPQQYHQQLPPPPLNGSNTTPSQHNALMPVMYHSVVSISNPSLGSPLYMNQHHQGFVPPLYTDQFHPTMSSGTRSSRGCPPYLHQNRSDKFRGPMSVQIPPYPSKLHYMNNNNPLAPDNNEKNVSFPIPYQKRPYNNRNNNGSYFHREGCPRYGTQNGSRYLGAGTNGGPPRGASQSHTPGGRFNSASTKRNAPPCNRSPPPAPYSPLIRPSPDSCLHYASISPQFHPGARQTYYQPSHQNSNIAGGNGSVGQRRYLGSGTRKSSSMNGNRTSGSNTSSGKYSRMGMNGVQALVPPKMMVDKGGAGDAQSLIPMTPPGTPHGNTGNVDGGIQDACHEMQALAL